MKAQILAALMLLAGCAPSSHIVVGTTRPKIDPATVKIYLSAPAKFEQVAVLEASSRQSLAFTDQGKTDKVMQRLKSEAASLGANGVLLGDVGERQTGSVTTGTATGYGNSAVGTGVTAGIFEYHGKAIAIYVEPASGP